MLIISMWYKLVTFLTTVIMTHALHIQQTHEQHYHLIAGHWMFDIKTCRLMQLQGK